MIFFDQQNIQKSFETTPQVFSFFFPYLFLFELHILQLVVQMGELLIKQGTLFHSIISQKLKGNQQRTSEIKKFSGSIIQLLDGFAGDLTNSCRMFFRKLKIDESQDENIIFLSKYIIDILNQLSKKTHTISKRIELDVVDPLNQFSQNQIKNHRETLLRSEEYLNEVQSNNDMLRELNQNYKINQSSSKPKEQKQMLKAIVESDISKCNFKWQQIKRNYQQLLGQLNTFNSLRCHFTMKTQIQIVRLINRLVNSTSVDDSLQDYDELYLQNETISFEVKEEMKDRLGKLVIFQEMDQTDIYTLVSSQADEKQKKVIDDFVGLFTNRSNLHQDQKSYEESRSLILEQMRWTNYFLNKLRTSLHTQIKLTNSKFRQLASILKYIFALIVEADDNEPVIYNLLYISYRVRHNDHYLIKELGKHDDFWKNNFLWESIIEYIRLTKIKGKMNSQDHQSHRYRLRDMFNKALWGWAGGMASPKKIKSQKMISQTKVYQILCEVNYYMAKLQLQQPFIFEFIQNQSAKYGITKQNVRKLLQYHYLNRMNTTNKQNATYLTRKQRLEEQHVKIKSGKGRMVIAVKGSLKYLPGGKDLVNLMLVCRDWSQSLRKDVFRRYLIEEKSFAVVCKYRLKIYKAICNPPFSQSVYRRMVEQIPQFTQHIEIINLDTRRSLGWDQTLRVKMIQILNAFSFYHPDNGYLQGMNYLCQNILKLTDDTFTCYYIFEHLMNNQYYGMYTGNFDGLKLKIYQFMRLLQRELPQLYRHFMAEKIEGEHFLLSWTITLWGQMSGELCWIMWDGFLVQGWIWWFKVILWLMKVLEPMLTNMNFQQIMKCFSDLHSSLFSYSLQELNDYGIKKLTMKKQIDHFRIQKEVLQEIEKEYKLKSNMINEYIQKIEKKK